MRKPLLKVAQIWNMSIGFLGIQFGFALQNANASRVLQTFGADVEHLSWFWLAAPITGLIIQPIIGYFSDRTWCSLGRRRPYFLVGAIMTSIALCLMPNAGEFAAFLPPMFIGAGLLMIMDASINVAMEPFRALVGDQLPSEQRTLGFSIQTFLIGIGAVLGSWVSYVLAEWLNVSKVAPDGGVPDNVIISFYIGAAVLMATIVWTVVKTKEYSPEEQAGFFGDGAQEFAPSHLGSFASIVKDIKEMPFAMRQLGVVQFFSWFALFSMWVFTTPAIAGHLYGSADPQSEAYQMAGNWVGVLFGVYNFVAMLYALALPVIAKFTNRRITHAISLCCGAVGLVSIYFIKDPNMLILSMVGVGIAWASILAMPYAMLAGSLPAAKMGLYMGIFNFFITLPQIVSGVFNGPMVKRFFGGEAIYAIVMAGVFLLIAAVSVVFVKEND